MFSWSGTLIYMSGASLNIRNPLQPSSFRRNRYAIFAIHFRQPLGKGEVNAHQCILHKTIFNKPCNQISINRLLKSLFYLYNGIPVESLNQNIILTASPGIGGVTSQGSSTSLPGTAHITLAGTEKKTELLALNK